MFELELFSAEFASAIFQLNPWYKVTRNWSDEAVGNIVTIPQGATRTTAVALVDGSAPYAVGSKTIGTKSYVLEDVGALPRRLNIKHERLSDPIYRNSLMTDAINELKEYASLKAKFDVQPASTTFATTGAVRTNIYGLATAKAITLDDLLKVRAKLIKDGASANNLYIVVDSIMAADIYKLMTPRDTQLGDSVLVEGYVGQIAGFKVIETSTGLAYTGAGAKPATFLPADNYANTHRSAALCFDASKLGYAMSNVSAGIEKYATGYYGDVMQASMVFGASTVYTNNEGVVALIEGV